MSCSNKDDHEVISHGQFVRVALIVIFAVAVVWISVWPLRAEEPATAEKKSTTVSPTVPPSFESDILPILSEKCLGCHGAETQESQLDLRTLSEMLRGGEMGPGIVPGRPKQSVMFDMITRGKMPPDKDEKLSDKQIATIRRWIKAGAPAKETVIKLPSRQLVSDEDRQFPAFRKLLQPKLPVVQLTDRVRTGIDNFVLEKLEAKGLTFSTDASRQTLIRRAYFDLTGLPPSPREIDAFLTDDSPQAYENLIDTLLASPHFGVRWGRHWLDAAGYVDVYGSDENAPSVRLPPGGWRYRDYVVRALNQDKSYDRFLLEQIAGDELVDWRTAKTFTPEMKELLVATGFLRTAIDDTDQDVLNIPSNRYATLFDQMQIMGSCVMGLTLQCARCHSHKFDPIPQRDYYRLMANFTPAYNPDAWVKLNKRTLPNISSAEKAENEKHNAEIDSQVKKLKEEIQQIDQSARERIFENKLAVIPESIREKAKTAVKTPSGKRTEEQKKLAAKYEAELKIDPKEVASAFTEDDKKKKVTLNSEISTLNAARRSWGHIQALYDTGPPPETHLLIRGEFENRGRTVKNGFLSMLSASDGQALAPATKPEGQTSGRRLAFAQWLTKPETPASALVARVMVNRIWHHLFGRGIVATPGNLGHSGTPPTHPELLDWLSSAFVKSGWKIKPLIRQMMTSTVYRQTSTYEAAESKANASNLHPFQIDPENKLLWRMRLRRLDAESIRDSILATSGKLDRSFGGPPVPLKILPSGMMVIATSGLSTPTSQWRRSLYLTSRRNYNISLLSVFDMPVISTNCTARTHSAVVLQSLTMLNDAFVLRQADLFASRVVKTAGSDSRDRIKLAYRISMARTPSAGEASMSSKFLVDQTAVYRKGGLSPEKSKQKALGSMCQMLLNSNHFLYLK